MKPHQLGRYWLAATLLMVPLSSYSTPDSDNATVLDEAQIQARFSGQTARCEKTKDASHCLTYFSANGDIKRLTLADQERRSGHWFTKNDRLCVHWNERKKPVCFTVKEHADSKLALYRKGKQKSLIHAFESGNQLGF